MKLSNIKSFFRLIGNNIRSILLFQLIVIYVFFILAIFRYFFVVLIKSRLGINVLLQENFKEILSQPLTLIFLLIFLVIELFFLLLGMIGIYRIYAASIQGKRFQLRTIWKECLSTYVGLFHPKRILLIPLLLLSMLFSYVGFYPDSMESFRIPEFVVDGIQEQPQYAYYFIAFRILMTLVWAWLLLVVAGVFLEHKSFKEARKQSGHFIKAHPWRFIGFLLMLLVLTPLIKMLLYFLILQILYLFASKEHELLIQSLYQANWRASIYIPLITDFLQIGLVVWFYCMALGIPIQKTPKLEKKKSLVWQILPIIVLLIAFEIYHEYYNPSQVFSENLKGPELIAHRAGGTYGPENSIKALEVSKESKLASIVEIDVQLTKDHEVVLNHDPTFKRTTGNPAKVSDLTLAEIKKLKTKDSEGKFTEPAPVSLNEFLDKAGDMKVMIELKGEKARMEKLLDRVFDIVAEKKFESKAMIAAMDRDILKLSKAKHPNIPTVFITAVLIGANFTDEDIDMFSLEAVNLSSSLVEKAHANKKKVYVWTVNSQRGVRKVLRYRPDGIVTDNVYYLDYLMNSVDDKIPYQNDIMLFFLLKDPSLADSDIEGDFPKEQ